MDYIYKKKKKIGLKFIMKSVRKIIFLCSQIITYTNYTHPTLHALEHAHTTHKSNLKRDLILENVLERVLKKERNKSKVYTKHL